MTERDAYIALNMMEKIGPVGVQSLVSRLGSAVAIFEAGKDEFREAKGIGPGVAASILSQRGEVDWEGEQERANALGMRLVAQVDDEYPALLREIHDPPLALYVKGNLLSRDSRSVAVVGTRRATHYGMASARKLSSQLARSGLTILSGLALGIDTAAHEGALKAGGRTVAVIGSGLNCLYPAENGNLAERIAEHGAVISEFPLGRKPDKTTFPMRNRIVSGLSEAVLVVEAGRRSGATITANQALQQGRSVFAVPGRIDSYASIGAHELIKCGAYLVTDADDILEHFEMLFPHKKRDDDSADRGNLATLSEEESLIVGLLERGEKQVDAIIRESKMNPATVNAFLLSLELKKMVRMLPGRRVERLR